MRSLRLLTLGVLSALPAASAEAREPARTEAMVIDRVEEGFAAVEVDGMVTDVPIGMLPSGVREGAVVRVYPGPGVVLQVDPVVTRRAVESAVGLQESLRRGPDGDLGL